jgi:tetratricopeptide (TPR) repeat protein
MASFSNLAHAKTNQDSLLEEQIWTADDHQLSSLESKVVRLIQNNPQSPFYHYLLSHLSIRLLSADPSDMRLMSQASQLAQQAIDLNKKSEFGYLALAELMDLMGHSKKGVQLLQEFKRTVQTPSWRLTFALARLSIDSDSNEQTLALFEKSLASPNAITSIIAPYASAVLQSAVAGDSTEKLASWNKKHPDPLFSHLIAIKQSELGHYDLAHKEYSAILKQDPSNVEAMINDAILLYKHLGKSKESLSLFRKLEKVPDHEISSSIRPILYAHMGAVYLKVRNKEKAQEQFILAFKSTKNLTSMVNFISKNYKDSNNVLDLVRLLNQANIDIPGKAILHAYLGEIYSEDLKQHQDAVTPLANAITLDSSQSEYYNALGLAYYRMQDMNESLKLFTAASMVNPKDSTAQYNMACVLSRIGKPNEALNALSTAINLDPQLEQVAANDSDFKNINQTKMFQNLINHSNSATQVAH